MASLKRRIATVQVKLRRKQKKKEEKQLLKLQKARNKSLNDAKRALRFAQAKEDAKDAALKKTQAKSKLSKAKAGSGSKLVRDVKSGATKLFKDIKANQKQVKRKPAKRKTTKRK